MEHQLCFESYVPGTGDTKWKHAHTKQEIIPQDANTFRGGIGM